ncbi:C-type lectin 37Db [Drosophila rhopaloa]|uniref:Accessory gland protein Acp29AB n=1 Tax=Drosophila rhopaloa TaxID=1041015 RepID=A0A6P4F6I0_DRORH|nr:C-type lectin 37Db [Drosophila rhopaloa]
MERILNAIDEAKEKLDGIQAKLEGNPEPDTPGFERIGSRYFFIEHEDRKSWTGAEIACRQKGGYLAAFQNQEEFDGIKEKLQIAVYWLGINQKIKEGDFVSVASGKPATFLNWMLDEPFNYDDIKEDCVLLVLGQMSTRQCDLGFHFICQLDNKV